MSESRARWVQETAARGGREAPRDGRGRRRAFYFTAAAAGAAIMVIEILGAKMLSPYVGTSHFVWTAQIAVTLVALALGYYLGGKLADLSPRPAWIHGSLIAAGAYLALTVLVIEPIALWCVELDLAFGSLVASTLLFLPPLVLLAMVGPFLLRFLAQSLSGVGGSAGRLSAVSTLGSVAGTVLIAYVLIPLLPNSATLFITAGGLMALGAVPFLAAGLRHGPARAAAVLLLAGSGLGSAGVWRDLHPRFSSFEEVHRSNSSFGVLQVLREKESGRLLFLNDLLTQNTYDPAQRKSLSLFTYMLHGLARAYTPRIEDALCIGLGVGIVPMELAREGAKVDVVEINPRVIPPATRFFDLDPSSLTIALGDGRQFIHAARKEYDAIVLDAFLGDSSPSHLLTREAFAELRRLLRAEGALVINVFTEFAPGRDFLSASLDKTLRAVFAGVRIHAAGNGNVFFVASPRAALEMVHPPRLEGVPDQLKELARRAYDGIQSTSPLSGRVLTDDYNPVEFHDAQNREAGRRLMALQLRRL